MSKRIGVKALIKRLGEAIAKLTRSEAIVLPKNQKGKIVQLPPERLVQSAKTIPGGNEKAAEDGKSEKATGDAKSEKAAGDAKSEKAAGDAKSEKAAGDAKREKAAGDANRERAAGDANREKAAGDAKSEKATRDGKTRKTEIITTAAIDGAKKIAKTEKNGYRPNIEKDSSLSALRALETLRFGLVPNSYIENITVGYDSLKEWIVPRMPYNYGNKACVYEISGPFGMGKSHMLAVMRHLAITNGYLYAKVEADARTLSFAYPETMLYNLWLNIEGHDYKPEYPLLELYLQAMAKSNDEIPPVLEDNELFRDNFGFMVELKNKGCLDKFYYLLDEALTSSDTATTTQIKAEIGKEPGMTRDQIKFQPLKRRTLLEQAELLVVSLVGHCLIAVAAGYKGLIIAIDEFEAHAIMSPDMRKRTAQVIHNINEYINDKTNLPQSPLGLCFATIGQDGAPSDQMIANLIDDSGGHRYILKPWSKEQRIITARKIYELYQKSYNISENFNSGIVSQADELLQSKGFSDTEQIRGFIKCYLALLDVEYCPVGWK